MNRSDSRPRSFSTDQLNAALTEVGGAGRPGYLDDILAQARDTPQRPAWTIPERWLPMTIAVRREGVSRAAGVLAVLVLLLALLAGTLALVGAKPAPPRLGVATNGVIAFEAGGDILVAEPDGSGQRTLIGDDGVQESIGISRDGRRLAYWTQPVADGPWDLVAVRIDGSDPVTVASGVIEVSGPPHPDWSPDGTKIAYSARTKRVADPTCVGGSSQNGEFCSSRIFVAEADGSGVRRIGDPELDARSPAWSPDGATIAFGGGNASPAIGIGLYLMDPDGGNVHQVSDVRGTDWAFVQSDWSHDGTKIVGQANAAENIDEWDIWVIDADGSNATNVGAHTGGDEILPSWAPDRDALAWFHSGIVLKEDGAPPVDLPVGVGVPEWSPDGKLLVTTTDSGLVVMDLRGGVKTTIEGANGFPAWQPLFGND